MEPHMQIARKIRSIETVKIELLQQVTEVYRGVHSGNQREVQQALGALIGVAYVLGVQLGFSPAEIERNIDVNVLGTIIPDEADTAGAEKLKRHFHNKR
ncbi:MazG-like family protein [Alicyclobacillus sp. SO9]|uniref:MazG-like family protein n=1 Tax=Alicyclobacillus sp. SO9 TaxID=2665646 RepID=UPI001E4CD65D|nr:MazG-like family protein [Alicyclobacillus sp. SO9]